MRLSGVLVSTSEACESNESVQIRRRFVGREFRLIRSVTSDSSGGFETTLEARRSAEYKATVFRTSDCDTAASDNVTVFVRVRITIAASENPVAQGNFFSLEGKIEPQHGRTEVVLERKVTKGWRRVDRVKMTRTSRYSFGLVAGWAGERSFRVRWPSQDHDHEPSTSRVVTVRSI